MSKTIEEVVKELEAQQAYMNAQAEYHRATAKRFENVARSLGTKIINMLLKR